jgi:phospholipid/cholesterol/gamma-HCH transport system ATP-binding protein
VALPPPGPLVRLQGVGTRFGAHRVHEGIDLEVRRAEIFALIGGSGSGKSTLLREMIGLRPVDEGRVEVLGQSPTGLPRDAARALCRQFGVMFQHGGLFASMTVAANVGLPLREHTDWPDARIDAVAAQKIALAGLPPESGALFPSALSGGMLKRASLARAIVLEPELLFLDEPTAGLDPQGAAGVDALVLDLRRRFGLTVVMVTHDLDLLWQVADRVAVLARTRLVALGTMAELSRSDDPDVQPFFAGPRGQRPAQTVARATGQAGAPSTPT